MNISIFGDSSNIKNEQNKEYVDQEKRDGFCKSYKDQGICDDPKVRQISYDAIVLTYDSLRRISSHFFVILRSYDSLWAIVLLLAFSMIEYAGLCRP